MRLFPRPKNSAMTVDDAAQALVILARKNRWSIADLWNRYENYSHRVTAREKHVFYEITSKACSILAQKL